MRYLFFYRKYDQWGAYLGLRLHPFWWGILAGVFVALWH